MKLRLYHYWRSSSSWRVRWAMAIKGVSCEFVSINLLTDESDQETHTARNPMGYVPVLEFLEEKRETYRFLGESMAIIEWLEDTFPSPSLLPGDPIEKAKIRQMAEIINAGTQPLQNPNVALFHSADPEEQKRWNQNWIRKGLHSFQTLAEKTSSLYSVGDSLTLADLYLIPQCYNAKRNGISLDEFPILQKIETAATQTESYIQSSPDRFAPA